MPRSTTIEEFFESTAKELKKLLRKHKKARTKEVLVGGVKRRHNDVMDKVAEQSAKVVMRNRSPRKK